jgi:hypothetical protein
MQVVTITAVDMLNSERHWTVVAHNIDQAAAKINTKLQRVWNSESGNPDGWVNLPISDTHSYIRSTPMGQLHFRIDRHDV